MEFADYQRHEEGCVEVTEEQGVQDLSICDDTNPASCDHEKVSSICNDRFMDGYSLTGNSISNT